MLLPQIVDGRRDSRVFLEEGDHRAEGIGDIRIHDQALEQSRLALAGSVHEKDGDAACTEVIGADVVFLPPSVESADDDHCGRRNVSGRAKQPAA